MDRHRLLLLRTTPDLSFTQLLASRWRDKVILMYCMPHVLQAQV